ncbi:transposase [Candidatus Uhrbacteria bacterium]|nr:transposase [Candidatus Uhrbacteria bacterium]
MRLRLHRSLTAWKRAHAPAESFDERDGKLILILDDIYFSLEDEEYICQILLARPVSGEFARLRGLVLVKGDESHEHWEDAFEKILTPMEESQICAIVADGLHGLVSLSNERGWAYQRCHFHLLKDLKNICGGHRGASRKRRLKIVQYVRAILDTPDERVAKRLVQSLKRLIAHPDCPGSVRKKISGFLKHLSRFRTCYHYPELLLPKTSNAAECVGRLIRERLGQMHGVNSVKALVYWLDVILREHPKIHCV